jgi:hypothetical protein
MTRQTILSSVSDSVRPAPSGPVLPFVVAVLVRVAARRSRPAGGHFGTRQLRCAKLPSPPSELAQKKVTKEEGLNTICLADVATNQRGLSTDVESTSSRASDEILSENGAAEDVCRPQCSVPPAELYPGGWRRAWRAPRSAGRAARARSALRDLTCRRLFERSERSERSELGDRAVWPSIRGQSERQRRPPGSARRRPPGCGSARSDLRRKRTAKGNNGPQATRQPSCFTRLATPDCRAQRSPPSARCATARSPHPAAPAPARSRRA